MVRAAAGGRATRACSCCVDGLLDDKVLMAGGATAASADSAVKSAELWDPATQAWTALPDMAQKRFGTAASVLPSGRVAVVGADNEVRKDGEVFDPVRRAWEPLPEMCGARGSPAAEPVAGGMIVSGRSEAELFDEESGRWRALPHPMAQPLGIAQLVSLPASALQAGAAAAGAGH